MAYDNTNKGALFKNDKRQTESHPEYKGSINVGGEEYWLSAWVKTSKAGNKFFSLSVQAKNTKSVPVTRQTTVSAPTDDFSDEIPF